MRRLLIIGVGGYGQLVREIAELCGYDRMDFLDDHFPDSVGKLSDLEDIQDRYDGCVVAIGNPDIRKQAVGAVVNHDAAVSDYCQVDCNAVVAPGVAVPEKTKVHSCTVWDKNMSK